jgi:hypothetical protein
LSSIRSGFHSSFSFYSPVAAGAPSLRYDQDNGRSVRTALFLKEQPARHLGDSCSRCKISAPSAPLLSTPRFETHMTAGDLRPASGRERRH